MTHGVADDIETDGEKANASTRSSLLIPLALATCAAAIAMAESGWVLLITEILIWVLFAASVNLLLTYGRLISFGQAAYFGLGGYGFALACYWWDVPPFLAPIFGPILATFAAFVFGALCVRLTAIYFAMLTLACAQIVHTVVFKWYDLTGGDTGLSNFAPSRLGLSAEAFGLGVLVVVTAGLYAMWWMVNAPIGLAIRSVGDNALRATALGYSRKSTQLALFVISGFWAGVAGSLFVAMHGNVFPDYAGVDVTLDGLIMVIVGGIGSFSGAVYGAVIYKSIDAFASNNFAAWEMVIGVVLLLIIMLSPSGFNGLVRKLAAMLRPGR